MAPTGLGAGAAKRSRDSAGGDEGAGGSEPSPPKRHAGEGGGKGAEAPFKATIAKIRMRDFLAYDDVELEPGPQLNLIVGPNGSGKSTIVAAICLGLGGSIKIIDRSNETGFIRRGQSKGTVEIWLHQRGGELMHIKREINSSGGSNWFMNGKPKKHVDITKFTHDNNIMLDNLCHFMPQEKVQIFSETAGKPEEMLEQVQKAVCPESMLKMHQELKDLQKKGSTIESDHQAATKLLKEQQAKEVLLADEMQRFEQLCELEEKLRLREKKMPWVKKFHLKEKWKVAKNELAIAQKESETRRSAYSARSEELKEKEQIEKRAKDDIGKFHRAAENAAQEIADIENRDQELCESEREFNQSLKDIDKKVKEQQIKIAKKESECEQLREKLAKAGPPPKDIDKKIKDAADVCKKVNDGLNKVKDELRAKEDSCKQLQNEMTHMQKKLNSHRDPRQLRLQALGPTNPLKIVRNWLDENTGQFAGTVWGPISLELEVDNMTDGEMVASAINKHLNNFVVESRKDFDRMHQLMDQEPKLRQYKRNIDIIDASNCPAWIYPDEDIRQLKSYGVEGYLIDRVKGPKPVINALCELVQFQRMLVGTKKVWDECFGLVDRPELIKKGTDNKKRHRVCGAGCFVPQTGRVVIQYSFYGEQRGNASQQGFYDADKSRIAPSGGQDKDEFERRFKDAEERLNVANEEKKQIQVKEKELNQEKSRSVERVQQLKEERQGSSAIQAKLKLTEKMLKEEKDKDHTKDRPILTKKRDNVINQRMSNVAKVVVLAKKSFSARKEGLVCELKVMTMLSDVQRIRQECSELRAKFKEAEEEAQRLLRAAEILKRDLDEAASKCDTLTEEEKEIFRSFPDEIEELEKEISLIREDIGRLGVANNRLRELEQCRAQIKELQEKVGDGADVMNIHREKMQAIKTKWLDGDEGQPGLRKIIETVDQAFSQMFQEMGNTGQVKLKEAKIGEEDDFIHYSLEILVMFRNADIGGGKMNQLNGKLHSGGERSVTIMLFLIALQQMTQCPFRVVDEINQGMDIHNEKWVFDYVVEHNCKKHKSQFFLITPKLQANLLQEMKDHITVFCIFKGQHMLSSGDWVKHGMLAPA